MTFSLPPGSPLGQIQTQRVGEGVSSQSYNPAFALPRKIR
jgi:hypothetical protein